MCAPTFRGSSKKAKTCSGLAETRMTLLSFLTSRCIAYVPSARLTGSVFSDTMRESAISSRYFDRQRREQNRKLADPDTRMWAADGSTPIPHIWQDDFSKASLRSAALQKGQRASRTRTRAAPVGSSLGLMLVGPPRLRSRSDPPITGPGRVSALPAENSSEWPIPSANFLLEAIDAAIVVDPASDFLSDRFPDDGHAAAHALHRLDFPFLTRICRTLPGALGPNLLEISLRVFLRTEALTHTFHVLRVAEPCPAPRAHLGE